VNGSTANTVSNPRTINPLNKAAGIGALSNKTLRDQSQELRRKIRQTGSEVGLTTWDLQISTYLKHQRINHKTINSTSFRRVWTQIEGWVQHVSYEQPFRVYRTRPFRIYETNHRKTVHIWCHPQSPIINIKIIKE